METDSYVYDAFGAVTSSTGTTSNDWLFTGEQRDGDSELYFLRARYYDPEIGRFLGQDPIEFAQRYAYAGNNPATMVDPSGREYETSGGVCYIGLYRDTTAYQNIMNRSLELMPTDWIRLGAEKCASEETQIDFDDPDTYLSVAQTVGYGVAGVSCTLTASPAVVTIVVPVVCGVSATATGVVVAQRAALVCVRWEAGLLTDEEARAAQATLLAPFSGKKNTVTKKVAPFVSGILPGSEPLLCTEQAGMYAFE